MEQLSKEELGVDHKLNVTQDWFAVTEEAKLRLAHINRIYITKQMKQSV